MTPAEVITEVRRLVQDQLVPYRYSDTVLLGYVNQSLQRLALRLQANVRPRGRLLADGREQGFDLDHVGKIMWASKLRKSPWDRASRPPQANDPVYGAE